MTVFTYLSTLEYTRNIQLFSGLLYFLTITSICIWVLVFLSTLARSYFRRLYLRQSAGNKEGLEEPE